MEKLSAELAEAMIAYYHGDAKRIHHFMKVYAFAETIAVSEQVNAKRREIIEAAALVHDIGIHAAEKKHKSAAGCYQEIEGPPIACAMLMQIGYSSSVVDRVCFLVGHHHSYQAIDEIDFQILVEADFLANVLDEGMKAKAVREFRDRYFKTETGITLLNHIIE
ncbi:MAG: HD domain-containing protein [Ruminococcus sp.]